MTQVQKSIKVGVRIAVAYGQWTQFRFMAFIETCGEPTGARTGQIHGSVVTRS